MRPTACAEFRRGSGLTRRRFLQAGGLGVLGLTLPRLLAAEAATAVPNRGRARSCILLFMWGGPSQLDTWDMKPDAPAEIRGPFQPMATNVPGLQISEHFPRLAHHADKYAVVRTLTHDDPAHLSSVHHMLTGRHAPRVKSDADAPSRRDTPHIGSVLARLRPVTAGLPPFVSLPWIVSHPAAPGGIAPGQNGGWLGPAYDPFVVAGDPNTANFSVGGLTRPADISPERLSARGTLLSQVGRTESQLETVDWHQRAFDLLSSNAAREAFDLSRESPRVRDRYGRNIHGQGILLARRLIEAGVRLVCVNWHNDGKNFWDTHGDNFNRLRNELMPPSDQGFSALLDDLQARGLLDETLVVWVGEFGRTPRISDGNAGREHWPFCYPAVLAGGGVRGGQVYGRSDRHAGYPADLPVTPADLAATIYHALGVPPDTILPDREGRPLTLTEGVPLLSLFA